MKRFFTALCVFCFTAIFASAEEPELIKRPLSCTYDSIQIVWNIEEQQHEKYEWCAKSDRVKSSSVENTTVIQNTHTTTDTETTEFAYNAEGKIGGGIGFSAEFFKNWGLQGSVSLQERLGWKLDETTTNTQQNEWVKSVKNTSQISETEDASQSSETLKSDRKLKFTVNFVNHTDEDLIFDQGEDDTIPIYCGNEQLGVARPVNSGEFIIPHHTSSPMPCQFQMTLNDSGQMKLLESAPDIRILGSQIKVYNREKENVFTQSTRDLPSYTVRLTADNASREWKFKYYKKHTYALHDVFEAINEDCEDGALFEFNEDGSIRSVAGYKVKLSKKPKVFVLFAWNGKPFTDLKEINPRKNSVLDVILVSRALLETRQSNTLTALIPFRETLETWAKEGRFDGKYLEWNLLANEDQRIVEIKKMAEAGDAEMQYELGLCYWVGRGIEKDEAEGDKWLLKSAEQGFATACNLLVTNSFFKKNFSEAKKWYMKTAEKDDMWGYFGLGQVCSQEKNYTEAFQWYQKAAEKGNVFAQIALGKCYLLGLGTEKNEQKGVQLFKKVVETDPDYKEAYYLLGYCYEEGYGVTKDLKKAVEYYELALPNYFAVVRLAFCYYNGIGVGKDRKKVFDLLTEMPEHTRNPDALRLLGCCYWDGEGTEKSHFQAVQYFKKAAEAGDAPSMYMLALALINGDGVEMNRIEGMSWMRKAADKDWKLAKDYLKNNSSSGGYQSSYSSGNNQSSGSYGSDEQYFQTGLKYFQGYTVTQNYETAVYYFRIAANNGHSEAERYLGWCYEHGYGVRTNQNEAVSWYRKAAAKGNEKAKDNLRLLGY